MSSFLNLFPGFLLIATVDRDGERYLDDDDVLSSGQVSPLSTCVLSWQLHDYLIEFTSGDYRPTPFTLNTNPNSNRASTMNLSVPQALNSQNYEHVLRKLLNKNKKRQTRQTGRKEEELSGTHEEGAGEMDSDMSEARRHAAEIGKGKEKARFHSLLSVVDGEGVQIEKELEQDNDREEWEWEEWEEGRRKSLFDPRR